MEIHHIGSTAVPGLPAKPVIDIMLAVRKLEDAIDCIGPLSDLGYTFIDYPQNTDRRFFRKGVPRTHHVHIVAQGNAELRDHLAFRDALRSNPEWRDQYAALKFDLAERHRNDRAQYSESKTEFVRRVLSIHEKRCGTVGSRRTKVRRSSPRGRSSSGSVSMIVDHFFIRR